MSYHLFGYHKNAGFINKIDISSLHGVSIIASTIVDNSIWWMHNLASDKELVFIDENYMIFYSKKFDFYSLYFICESDKVFSFFKNDDPIISNNYFHYLLCDSRARNSLLNLFEEKEFGENFKYSILNINSEVFYETEPFDLNSLKKVSYLFSGGTLISQNSDKPIWLQENSHKFILDFKYPLHYFYHKFGFVYYQHGPDELEISNRKNKVFLYSKHAGQHTARFDSIKHALNTDRIFEKSYSNEDWFWYYQNYNYYHMPFYYDYNLCKFNLVMETQHPSQESSKLNLFLSEKCLKALMVSTPAYVMLVPSVYKEMTEYGFYFLNSEFGTYNMDEVEMTENLKPYPKKWNQNYHNFLNFIKTASDKELDDLFAKAFEKSKNNKVILEKYLYEDKVKEINLLLGRDGRVG